MATDLSTLPQDYHAADQGHELDTIAIVCFTLAIVAVLLRLLARTVIRAPIWWDDFMIVIALVLLLVLDWLMPLPYMWRLQVAKPNKVAVTFVFILGGLVAIVSVIRLTVLLSLDNQDVTWTYVPTCVWTNIEVHIGIVSASDPAFRPLLRAIATGSVRLITTRSVIELRDPGHSHGHAKPYRGRRIHVDEEEEF